ncbi:MAG: TRP-like protein [Polyangiaceae bacterium]
MRPEEDASAALVRADVLVLLREKRYEEALEVLYRARAESPASSELQRSIDQIKEFLIGAYAKRLGGLDQIARPIPITTGRSPDVVLISRYLDGNSTLGDVAQMCPLGKLRTLQVLVGLYAKSEPRVSNAEPELPRSGLHSLGALAPRSASFEATPPSEDVEPETARSPSSLPKSNSIPASIGAPPAPETPQERQYRELFGSGTVAFVQKRFADAVEAFRACEQLRPGDQAASVMLRRSIRDLESP